MTFRSVGQRSRSKVKPTLHMLGKGAFVFYKQLYFQYDLFGIDHTITPSNTDDSVAFQCFTISWNLNRGYKTKVITLPPKKSTITSNKEKRNDYVNGNT